jgi:spore maturation protein CgeB
MLTTLPEVYNSSKGKLFVDGEHFISINTTNYLSKIKYYLENDEERIKIANNMHEYWKNNYSAEIWWNNIISWSK